MSDNWHLLEFCNPITEYKTEESLNDFIIRGIAITETTTHNGHKYIAEELQKATGSLMGRPVLVDHDNRVESIKGRITNSFYNPTEKRIEFEAKIMDKTIQEMIRDGRINNVSIGAFAEDLVKEEETLIARGIKIVELSLVAVPADENASFVKAMNKNYKLKESLSLKIEESERRYGEMEENKLQEMESEKARIVEEHKKAMEELTILRNERRQSLVNEYKKMCSEKKVSEKDISNVSEETIKLLIEQLKEISIPTESKFKSQIAETPDISGLDRYVVERSQWVKGTAIWKMPDTDRLRELHRNLPFRKNYGS